VLIWGDTREIYGSVLIGKGSHLYLPHISPVPHPYLACISQVLMRERLDRQADLEKLRSELDALKAQEQARSRLYPTYTFPTSPLKSPVSPP
jgi:hypothetical protein